MHRIDRAHREIWQFDERGKAINLITLGGIFSHWGGVDDLNRLQLAWRWTWLSIALWLQDITTILGRKA